MSNQGTHIKSEVMQLLGINRCSCLFITLKLIVNPKRQDVAYHDLVCHDVDYAPNTLVQLYFLICRVGLNKLFMHLWLGELGTIPQRHPSSKKTLKALQLSDNSITLCKNMRRSLLTQSAPLNTTYTIVRQQGENVEMEMETKHTERERDQNIKTILLKKRTLTMCEESTFYTRTLHVLLGSGLTQVQYAHL